MYYLETQYGEGPTVYHIYYRDEAEGVQNIGTIREWPLAKWLVNELNKQAKTNQMTQHLTNALENRKV